MLVMKYGLRPPNLNADMVRQQMRAAHQYRNVLVEIERGRRAAVRLMYADVGDIPALQQRAKDADEHAAKIAAKVKAHKSSNRTRKVPDGMRQELDAARVMKRDAAQAWKTARHASNTPEMQAELDRINGLAGELRRSAYNYSPCFWGTKVQVVAPAMDAVCKAPIWGVMRKHVWYPLEPNIPSFVRWKGDGRVGVQVQNGMPSELAFFDNAWLQIERVPDRFGRPNSPWAILRMRIGSDGSGGRTPVWAEWPMKMHRPLPPGKIKAATVSLSKIGPREEWSVEITVDNESICRATSGYGQVAVNFGWRRVDGGIRVAYTVDDEGEVSELIVDDAMLSSLAKADELMSIRDGRFNDARDALGLWLSEHDAPDWLRTRTRTMHAWKAKARLASLALHWKCNRFDGDSEAYEALERWRYRDQHLWTWESDQRVKSRRRRLDMYRVWSARLAERYHTIVLPEHDMRKTARKPPDGSKDNEVARANRQLVAPSTLKLALVNAKRTRDGATVQTPAAPVTKTCHECGSIESFDAEKHIVHTCSQCRATWDQDENAARNTLRLYHERSGDAKILGTARDVGKMNEDGTLKETKRQRIARLGQEKEARLEAARNSSCMSQES
jgi:hypothetical protein